MNMDECEYIGIWMNVSIYEYGYFIALCHSLPGHFLTFQHFLCMRVVQKVINLAKKEEIAENF